MGHGSGVYGAHVTIDETCLDEVKVQLRAMGLIEPGRRRRPVTDATAYWALISHGEDVLLEMSTVDYASAKDLPENEPPSLH